MGSNGNTPKLRVLLSGPAADRLAATLEQRARDLDAAGSAKPAPRRRTDVALHVRRVLVGRRTSPRRSAASARSSTRRSILAAYGEPNGIVETGLAVGAADVLVLPQPTETLLFALRKAAIAAAATDDRQGRHRLLAEGRKRQDRAGDEPRGRGRALRPEDAPRRPRPAVRRLGADARQ